MKKILVIDGNSIINRAFYGVRPLTTKSGKPTNAVYGMIQIIQRQLDAIRPDYAAVAFDLKAPTFRHKMYEHYKEGRHPTPPELLAQFDDAKECLRALGLHVLELAGYEADDLQGTVAYMAYNTEDTESYILSGDRDLLQLIGDRVSVLLATNHDTVTMREGEFVEKYGIPPKNFVDMKALMGDSSDNIPGVRGIGEKTAASLISNFETLEGIYDNIDDKRISKGVREKLLADRNNAFLSRTLAKIDTAAPMTESLSDLKRKEIDKDKLYRKLTELELNQFIVKYNLQNHRISAKSDGFPSDSSSTTNVNNCMHDTSDASLPTWQDIDLEVLRSIADQPLAIEVRDGILYVSTEEKNYRYHGDLTAISFLFSTNASRITYDAKALIHTLAHGDDLPTRGARYLDLMLYAYLLDPGSGSPSIPSLITQFLMEDVPDVPSYTPYLFRLEKALRERVREMDEERVLDEIELPLIPILAEMEHAGIRIDTKGITEFGEALHALAEELAGRIYMQAGEVFNLNSPKQLGEVLFVKMGLSCKKKKTKSGFSTDAETLEELRGESPIIDDILEYRQVTKLHSTYTSALVNAADADGRVHTDFKQALTATGRLSSADPNLQNIPIRTKMGREMRRYFIAKEGCVLVDADYSQIELRLLAHISDDYNMIEGFRSGADIHRKTAAAVFCIPEEFVTDELRLRAKAVNFGIVYGISGFSLSKDIGTTVGEASKYIKNYKMNYPGVDAYLDEVVRQAEADGYTTTLYGRRRLIPELRAQAAPVRAFGKRVAMNAPIQGTAADIMKIAMIRVHRRLLSEGLESRLIMQVHDELLIEAPLCEEERARAILKEEMEAAATLSIPLTVDVSAGRNWLEQA